jgi:protein phosphatase
MRIEIALPEPCLVVLVGAAGSGKSTFAARWFEPQEILSSDALRARVGRGEDDQLASGGAFKALAAALAGRLAQHLTTVVDATNVHREARRRLVRASTTAGMPAVAIVLDLDLDACLAGDLARPGRRVGRAVIEHQWTRLRDELGRTDGLAAEGSAAEGFAAVHRLADRGSVDSAVVRRHGVRRHVVRRLARE